ncbi:MAG: hypothetical protein ACOY3P_17875 [Planctomycetota bacterium]
MVLTAWAATSRPNEFHAKSRSENTVTEDDLWAAAASKQAEEQKRLEELGQQADTYAAVGIFLAVLFLCIPMAISGGIGAAIGARHEGAMAGFAFGCVLGPIGWLIAAFYDARPLCVQCAMRVPSKALVCPYCHQSMPRTRRQTQGLAPRAGS